MKLPGGDQAIVDIAKLREYCLNLIHPRGRYKARVFAAILGLTAEDAESLRNELLRAATQEEARAGQSDEYGKRYIVDFILMWKEKRATIRSAWIIRGGEDFPRLLTCYVLLD